MGIVIMINVNKNILLCMVVGIYTYVHMYIHGTHVYYKLIYQILCECYCLVYISGLIIFNKKKITYRILNFHYKLLNKSDLYASGIIIISDPDH